MKKIFILLLCVWLTPKTGLAQNPLDSVYYFVPGYGEDFHALAVDNDTLVVMRAGFDTLVNKWGINLLKIDTLGNILYSNMLSDTIGSHIVSLYGNKIIKTSDGGYAYGASYAHNPACKDCIFFAKYKHSGELDFVKYYQRPDTTALLFAVNNILQLEDGGYFLFSFYILPNAVQVPHLIRTDAIGNELWSRDYGAEGDTNVVFADAIAMGSNKFVITGGKDKTVPVYVLESVNPYLMIMDSLGNIIKEYNGKDSLASTNIEQADDGGFIQTITKVKTFSDPFYTVAGIRKLDSNFVEQWVRYTDDTGFFGMMEYLDLIKTLDGNYIACGPKGLQWLGDSKTAMHIKISESGEVIWERFDDAHYWNGEETNGGYPWAIGALSSGSTVSVCSVKVPNKGERGLLLRITPGGCVHADTIGCWAGSVVSTTQAPVVSLEVQVYPNPATDELTIQLTGDLHQKAYIYFYDVTGRLLSTDRSGGRKHQLRSGYNVLDISDLHEGMIFYTINSKEGVLAHGKLVKM